MMEKIKIYLSIFLSLLILTGPDAAYAANYIWTQTDWSDGADQTQSGIARHPGDQTGWTKFYDKDPIVDVSVQGQVSLSPVFTALEDKDFNGGTLSNVTLMGSGDNTFLKLTDYTGLDFGPGGGDLVIDGLNPAGSTDGQVHPREISPPQNLTVSTGSGNLTSGYYYYRVVAFNSVGESQGAATTYYLASGNKSIILQWDQIACADGYRIYGRGRLSPPEREFGLLTTLSKDTTTWEDNDINIKGITLTASTTGGVLTGGYKYYQITGVKSSGEETLIARGGVNIPTTSAGSVTMTWNPLPWATKYMIHGRPLAYNGQYGLLTPGGVSGFTFTDTGIATPDITRWPGEANISDGSLVIDGENNYANITVQNCGSISASEGTLLTAPSNVTTSIAAGGGPSGTVYYIVTAVDPVGFETARSAEKSIAANGRAVKVSWGAVTGAAGFRVYRRSSTGTYDTPSLVCSTSGTSCIDNLVSPMAGGPPINAALPTLSFVRSGTGGNILDDTYYYALTAVDASGHETTLGPQRTVSIGYGTGTSSVTLSWTKVSEAAGYRVYRSTTSALFNSPALVCKVDTPGTLSCKDTLQAPLDGAPPRSYYHALSSGRLQLRISDTLTVDSTSVITMSRRGYPGGDNAMVASTGFPGKGMGAGGDLGAGAGYAAAGGSNSAGNGNIGYPYGDELISQLHRGSGGASGRNPVDGRVSGAGGQGGGVISIFAKSADLGGQVISDGEKGGDGVYGAYADGGGGGSGGTVFIGTEDLSGAGSLSAAGVAGGAPASKTYYQYLTGGTGSPGRIRITPLFPVSGGFNSSPIALTGNKGIFESRSFELNSGGVDFQNISWNAAVPPNARLKFYIATNKDNAAWNFLGPDGTSSDPENNYYQYDPNGQDINSVHNGDRFIKYRVVFKSDTVNPLDNPELYDVTVAYALTERVQRLTSSPYDTMNLSNSINRWQWSENIVSMSDVLMQIRTCPGLGPGSSNPCAPDDWGAWLGSHSTTFSAPSGTSTITVSSATGFAAGSRITMTDAAETGFLNPAKFEIKKIVSISGNTITLDSTTSNAYGTGSILTDVYTDPGGTEAINGIHRNGVDDRWIQYRLYLFSDNAQSIPLFLESKIGYQDVSAIYQPDGIIEGDGNVDPPRSQPYGSIGTGGGGSAAESTDMGRGVDFNIDIQNDGTPESTDDVYTLTWNTPSDEVGTWTVELRDANNNLLSNTNTYTTASIPVSSSIPYILRIKPSTYAPPVSIFNRDVIIDMRSENDYATKVDSIKATVNITAAYLADGLIDPPRINEDGDNVYDPNRQGGGGTSPLKEAGPGEMVLYKITLQNEGNISDTYTLSLQNLPPDGWTVSVNDGSKDYDISNPSVGWTTPSIPPQPNSGFTKTFTLKIVPKGAPTPLPEDIILNIYSNGGKKYVDSLTARLNLKSVYKVDGVIYGYGASGTGCGRRGPGDGGPYDKVNDNSYTYGVTGSGDGGCTATDIAPGSPGEITVGVQNEGNMDDKYRLSWEAPAGWTVVIQERLNDGSVVEFPSPVDIPTSTPGNPLYYHPGEMPFFTFKITTPQNFSGSKTLIFDVMSLGDNSSVDSVKAIINSGDTTPPAARDLSTGSITATSVKVSWKAPGDDGTTGTAASYDLRYSESSINTDEEFTKATRVRGCKYDESNLGKPKSAGGAESCTVSQLFANTNYYFALKTSDEAGNTSSLSSCSGCPATTQASGDTTKPGTITDLTITNIAKDSITLCWTAPADNGTTSSSGPATAYELHYSTRGIVDDSVTPGVGEVLFSKATEATPMDGWLLPKSTGLKECYIVPVRNEITTGENVKDDRTRNTRFFFSIKALDEARNKSGISNMAKGLTPLVPYAYNMISVPYDPVPETPKDVLGDDVGAQLYVYHWSSGGIEWREGCYDGYPKAYNIEKLDDNSGDDDEICEGGEACYICSDISSIKEGDGYFLWVPPGDVILDVPDTSTEALTTNCADEGYGTEIWCINLGGSSFKYYRLLLKGGGNLFGVPFDKEINLTSRDINDNGTIEESERGIYVRRIEGGDVTVRTFQEAVTLSPTWLDGSIYTYNSTESMYKFEVCEMDNAGESLGTGCSPVMQPWKAYLIRRHISDPGATFELLIPK